MSSLTRQQLCAELQVCEATVRRLENQGMPFEQLLGSRRKTYDLVKCKTWLRTNSPGALKDSSPSMRNYYSANARAKALLRFPAWADKKAIRAVYEEAQRITQASGVPHHVDHDLPLLGALVSGLHVHTNLQILTWSENMKKHNLFQIEP